MCGAIGRVSDNPWVKLLMQRLNISVEFGDDHNIRPNASLPIAIGTEGETRGVSASWWLFQTKLENGYTFDKRYKSFNTRKDKLFGNRKRDFGYHRCVIPASCFYEWKGDRFKIEPVEGAIAFGGLYKRWPLNSGKSGVTNYHYSCSIITLPPHPKLSHIHDKSMPLMLLDEEISPWLDDSFHDLNYWQETLDSRVRFDLSVTPVDKKEPRQNIGATQIIKADIG